MPDSKRFLPPEVITRLGRLELQARQIVEGLLAGRHRSPYCGQSVEFVQHRQYTWGDELRHVDWRVWARHDRLYVKQFEENTTLPLTLVVDISASMGYGKPLQTKFDCAATLAACLAHLVLRQQDDVACITFDEAIRHRLPHRNHQRHLEDILQALSQCTPCQKTQLTVVVQEAAKSFTKRGIWVIISDLLLELSDLEAAIHHLRAANHEVVIFQILHEDELEFPFRTPMVFEDAELPIRVRCHPAAYRQGYLEALRQFLEQVREIAGRLQAEWYLVRRSEPLELPLLRFLSHRSRRFRIGVRSSRR
ncbi:MAG: DUF58 domain-containing protein [Thermoguttaceae bacterium]|nr:DUF58 domain-containing protein [Thermoguttaceae bacterium]MDW8077748.1 DUF58 domain-containing protein [Thermoguttaceae bacterium]